MLDADESRNLSLRTQTRSLARTRQTGGRVVINQLCSAAATSSHTARPPFTAVTQPKQMKYVVYRNSLPLTQRNDAKLLTTVGSDSLESQL